MMEQTRLNAALSNLERIGAPTGDVRSLAEFTAGLDLGSIRDYLGSSASTRLAPLAAPVVAGTMGGGAAAGGTFGGLVGTAGAMGSAISGLLMLGDFLAGLGDDAPKEAVNQAGWDQEEHEGHVADGCTATDLATEAMGDVQSSCVSSVEKICDSTVSFADMVKAVVGPGLKYSMVMGPVMGLAVSTIHALLHARNDSLGSCMDTLIDDHEPAAQPGASGKAVCREPAPPEPASATTPGSVETPPPRVEAAPCEVSTQTAGAAPISEPENCPPSGGHNVPSASPPSSQLPPQLPPQEPSHHVPVVPSTGSVASSACPPLIDPLHAQKILHQGVQLAAGAWQEFMGSVQGLLCPPELVSPPHAEPVAQSCPPGPIAEDTPHDCPPEPGFPPQIEPVAQECPPEQAAEDAPNDCPPEPQEEQTHSDCPPDLQTPTAEPTVTPEQEQQVVENTEQGFDKSKHPSVPEGAVPNPEPVAPEAQPSQAPSPGDAPPAPAPLPEAASEAAPEVQSPGSAADDVPKAQVPQEDAPSWTPDIWVSGAASLEVEVTAASTMHTPVTADQPISLERSGSW